MLATHDTTPAIDPSRTVTGPDPIWATLDTLRGRLPFSVLSARMEVSAPTLRSHLVGERAGTTRDAIATAEALGARIAVVPAGWTVVPDDAGIVSDRSVEWAVACSCDEPLPVGSEAAARRLAARIPGSRPVQRLHSVGPWMDALAVTA
jgi:hypothetical protein